LTLIAESHAKMLNHVSNFDFFDENLVGDQMQLLSGYARWPAKDCAACCA
jgi:circadian clock protein KaiC